MADQARFTDLWRRMGSVSGGKEAFEELIRRYAEKHRAYHTIDHVDHCLSEFDLIRGRLARPDEIETAIWFHDAVYKPFSSHNEAASAALATLMLQDGEAAAGRIQAVSELIIATRHDSPPPSGDAKYLLDIDLSILGSPPDLYKDYERRVRLEYKYVPGFIYRRKRAQILASFLRRERIYQTEFFHARYESMARENLNRLFNS